MPSQLLSRLRRYLNQQIAQTVMDLESEAHTERWVPAPVPPHGPDPEASNTHAHWPDGDFGSPLGPIQSIVIHETSGSPTYGGNETFRTRYTCTGKVKELGDRGIGPQYFVEPNGVVYNLIGDQDFANAPRQTWHIGWKKRRISMNPFTVGIENGDAGDSSVTPGNGTGPAWWALSTQAADLGGMKLYLLLSPGGRRQDAVLIWFARFASNWRLAPATDTVEAHWVPDVVGTRPGFNGPGDIVDGGTPATTRHIRLPAWRDMLFTERNIRSLVLLCRTLAEQHGVPRTFPLLPWASADTDYGNAAIFRKLLLAEQRAEEIAVQVGTTRDEVARDTPHFREWYGRTPIEIWSRFFGAIPGRPASPPAHPHPVPSTPVTPCYRGFLAHSANGGHPCPGPLFDWHRFAREVWDWWWYPFDLVAGAAGAAPTPSTARRPYFLARRDTPLVEYYWDAVGGAADYAGLLELLPVEETYRLPAATPVYALANGVLVAARLGAGAGAGTGFVLVRHEVYRETTDDRIDYDLAPTYVWTLVRCLDNSGFDIPAEPPAVAAPIPAANPSWLDRFVMRLRECELAVRFHDAHAATMESLRIGWGHASDGNGPRATSGREIEQDATAYREIARDLVAGEVAGFPLVATTDTTPVRVCLGDYLGQPGPTPTGRTGVQIEIFSTVPLPVPGAARRAVSASAEPWWARVTGTLRHETAVEADLPADGVVWHYPLADFAAWLNRITWRSEWQKYGVTVGGAAAPAPERPATRIVV